MNRIGAIAIVLLSAVTGSGQYRYDVRPAEGINTERNEILSAVMGDEPVYASDEFQDLVNDYGWSDHYIFQLKKAARGSTFNSLTPLGRLFPFPGSGSEGTASWNPGDSSCYFSSSLNQDGVRGNRLRIWRTKWTGRNWSRPEVLPFCLDGYDYAHPHFNPEMKLLVFSSSRPGGMGGMDIWYCFQNGAEWTVPVNPGILVNTPANELFPTVFRGDIYYSSNGILPSRGYELFRAMRKDQWKASVQLPDPLNSGGDDVMIVFLSEARGFVSSSRAGGKGGDDVYTFDRTDLSMPEFRYHAELEVEGKLFSGATVLVTNDLREVLLEGATDSSGSMPLTNLRFGDRVRFAVAGVDPALFTHTVLYLVDEHGNRVRALRLNEFGWVELELLPFDYSDLVLFPNADRSWLTVSLEGELRSSTGQQVDPGEPITIFDDEHKPVAVAYTRNGGRFFVDNLAPGLSYTFHLSEESRANQVVVLDRGREIVLPILKEEAIYQRTSRGEAIALVSERNETVFVAPGDLFVINRIYYDYRKSDLSDQAMRQLDQLAWLMERNQGVAIEVHAYTDSRGAEQDNLRLSAQRAEAVLGYLESKGVGRTRIQAFGEGESDLLNYCTDGVKCSEEEHAVNRRTEIRFVTPAGN